jgi:hypothetical protein
LFNPKFPPTFAHRISDLLQQRTFTEKAMIRKLFITLVGIVVCANGLLSQPSGKQEFESPFKYRGSPLFGKDVVINDQPDQDQQLVSVCSAFNGWLFAIKSFVNEQGSSGLTMLKSTDNGQTWNILWNEEGGAIRFRKLELIACGNDLTSLYIFCATSQTYGVGQPYCQVHRFKGEPFSWEDDIFPTLYSVEDIAISTDFGFPSVNSDPFSIAVIYAIQSSTPPLY